MLSSKIYMYACLDRIDIGIVNAYQLEKMKLNQYEVGGVEDGDDSTEHDHGRAD